MTGSEGVRKSELLDSGRPHRLVSLRFPPLLASGVDPTLAQMGYQYSPSYDVCNDPALLFWEDWTLKINPNHSDGRELR